MQVRIRSLSSDDSDVEIDIEDDNDDRTVTDSKSLSEADDSKTDDMCIVKNENESGVEDTPYSPSTVTFVIEEKQDAVIEIPFKLEDSESDSISENVLSGKESKSLVSHQDILDQIHQLPPPTHERHSSPDEILDEERRIHAEFFEGRPAKTPRRYLKVSNH